MFDLAEQSFLPFDYLCDVEANGSESYNDSLIWLKEIIDENKWDLTILEDNETMVFGSKFKASYFKDKLKNLKNKVAKLSEDDFNNNSLEIYDIKCLMDDIFDIRVIIDKECISFDEFVRSALSDKEKYTYYLKSITEYHF